MLPIPAFWSSQTAANSKLAECAFAPRPALGPAERLPAASNPVAVLGLVIMRLGRKGRFFSCFSRMFAAARSSRCDAISGRRVDRERDQLGRCLVAGDHRDLHERGFHRFEQGLRLEQEDFRQVGAGDPPVADREFARLEQTLELGLRAVNFQRGDQRGGQAHGEIDQPPCPHDRGINADQPSPGVLKGEVRLADRQQSIVAGRLYIGLPRGDHSSLGQRLVDRVRDSDGENGTAAYK